MFKEMLAFWGNLGFFGKILDYRERSWILGKTPVFFRELEWTGGFLDEVVDKWPTPKNQGLEIPLYFSEVL